MRGSIVADSLTHFERGALMLLSFPCPGCQFRLRVGAHSRGRSLRCPGCRAPFVLESEGPPAPPSVAPRPEAPLVAPDEGPLLTFEARLRGEGLHGRWQGALTR